MSTPITKKRILIVDDDPDAVEVLSLLLEDAGYEVEGVEHALAAVCAVVRDAPDLVLADIRMPIVDGMGLATELKTHLDTRDIPIVAVTGYDSPETRQAALKAGYDGYITKPIDPKRFPDQVAEFLGLPKPRQKQTHSAKRSKS